MASTKSLRSNCGFSKRHGPCPKSLILALLVVLSGASTEAQPRTANARPIAADHALIHRHGFPHRKTASVTYPVVSGLPPAILRRVRSILDFKNIFDYSLGEYRSDSWLSEFDYVVNYNADFLMDITFCQSGAGAYPDEQSRHFLINLIDGRISKARDVFVSDKLAQLASVVDVELQSELGALEKRNASDNDVGPQDRTSIKGAYENLKFAVEHLEDFSVGRTGITFLYDAGFPHVIQAFEPKGMYFFTYAQLRPFFKSNGPLGRFIP